MTIGIEFLESLTLVGLLEDAKGFLLVFCAGVTAQWPDQTVLQGTALQKISQDLRPRGLLHQEATKIELTRYVVDVNVDS
jgi:hypothetical protein